MKKFLLFTSIFIFPILFFAQSKTIIVKEAPYFDYIECLGDTSSLFFKNIEKRLGYRNALDWCIRDWDYKDYSGFTTKELEDRIHKVMTMVMTMEIPEEPLRDCDYFILLDTLRIISILKESAMEGNAKTSNSTVSRDIHTYPFMYNIKKNEEILQFSDFLTAKGEIFVMKEIRTMINHWYNKDSNSLKKTQYAYAREANIQVSLDENKMIWHDDSTNLYFYFYLSKEGLNISENNIKADYFSRDMVHNYPFILITYEELIPYIKEETLRNFAEKSILKAGNTYEVRIEKTYFHSRPAGLDIGHYLIKGDKCTSIKETKNWIYCEYKNKKGIVTKGWIPKTDLTLIIQ